MLKRTGANAIELEDPIAPKEPMILAKATSSICGPDDDVIHPPETRKLDYEVEVGIVIGRRARRICESQVRDHVAGFCVVNEMSARDIQLAEHETNPFYRVHFIGKSYDTFNLADAALRALATSQAAPLPYATSASTNACANGGGPSPSRTSA